MFFIIVDKIRAKKSLGQHFLIHKDILREIVGLAKISSKDTILEIGAGTGTLTEILLEKGDRLVAIEKDKALVRLLEEKFNKTEKLLIIKGDIRELVFQLDNFISPEKSYKLVANLPYYLSSFIIRKFLEANHKPETMVLLLQKELTERICANPGKMGLISTVANLYAKPKLGPIIKKEKFFPVPKVDSRVLILSNIKSPDIAINEKEFFRIVKIAFSSRRKTLLNNLKNGLNINKQKIKLAIKKAGLKENVRAQELSIDNWKRLTGFLGQSREVAKD